MLAIRDFTTPPLEHLGPESEKPSDLGKAATGLTLALSIVRV